MQMKNYFLLLMLALCVYGSTCDKNPAPPLSYGIDSVSYAYVPNNDSATFAVPVKFFTGNPYEKVWVTIQGLSSHVTHVHDTITGVPNFTADFVIYANDAAIGYYPVTLVSYSPSNGIRTQNFTLGVVTTNC